MSTTSNERRRIRRAQQRTGTAKRPSAPSQMNRMSRPMPQFVVPCESMTGERTWLAEAQQMLNRLDTDRK